mmetsp:Transcript_2688/g.9906  ORF Transcript_2688/g.9906 Transcript_2688/m.9906 type:complete len:511 (+) Transcript_2688:1338-2870(+)
MRAAAVHGLAAPRRGPERGSPRWGRGSSRPANAAVLGLVRGGDALCHSRELELGRARRGIQSPVAACGGLPMGLPRLLLLILGACLPRGNFLDDGGRLGLHCRITNLLHWGWGWGWRWGWGRRRCRGSGRVAGGTRVRLLLQLLQLVAGEGKVALGLLPPDLPCRLVVLEGSVLCRVEGAQPEPDPLPRVSDLRGPLAPGSPPHPAKVDPPPLSRNPCGPVCIRSAPHSPLHSLGTSRHPPRPALTLPAPLRPRLLLAARARAEAPPAEIPAIVAKRALVQEGLPSLEELPLLELVRGDLNRLQAHRLVVLVKARIEDAHEPPRGLEDPGRRRLVLQVVVLLQGVVHVSLEQALLGHLGGLGGRGGDLPALGPGHLQRRPFQRGVLLLPVKVRGVRHVLQVSEPVLIRHGRVLVDVRPPLGALALRSEGEILLLRARLQFGLHAGLGARGRRENLCLLCHNDHPDETAYGVAGVCVCALPQECGGLPRRLERPGRESLPPLRGSSTFRPG